MSWQEDELRKRAAIATRGDAVEDASAKAFHASVERVAALWNQFAASNESLPQELRLTLVSDATTRTLFRQGDVRGHRLRLRYDRIEYQGDGGSTVQFSIEWTAEDGYLTKQRFDAPSCPFLESSVEYIMRCLVTGEAANYDLVSVRNRSKGWFSR